MCVGEKLPQAVDVALVTTAMLLIGVHDADQLTPSPFRSLPTVADRDNTPPGATVEDDPTAIVIDPTVGISDAPQPERANGMMLSSSASSVARAGRFTKAHPKRKPAR